MNKKWRFPETQNEARLALNQQAQSICFIDPGKFQGYTSVSDGVEENTTIFHLHSRAYLV